MSSLCSEDVEMGELEGKTLLDDEIFEKMFQQVSQSALQDL